MARRSAAARRGLAAAAAALAAALAAAAAAAAAPVPPAARIGVLANRGPEEARRRWEASARYLEERIAGRRFEIVPLAYEDVEPAVRHARVEFLVVNTGIYVEMEAAHGASRIATRRSRWGGTQYGGVILARADRAELTSLADLKGRRVAVPALTSFGGWLMQLRELRQAGVDPEDLSVQTTGDNEEVVEAVRNAEVDAGFARTDTLEEMVADGRIRLAEVKAVARRDHPGFAPLHSTRLYPEWPFARLRHTDDALAKQVAVALLQLPEDHPAARAARLSGWDVPAAYAPVHELYRELELGPYRDLGRLAFARLARRWWPALAALALFVLLVFVWNHKLARLNRALAAENAERRRAEASLRASEARFRDLASMLPEIIYEADPSGAITFINEQGLRATGYSAEEARSLTLYKLVPPEMAEALRARIAGAMDRTLRGTTEYALVRRDGTRFPVLAHSAPIVRDGRVEGLRGILMDIGDRDRLAESLRVLRRAVEQSPATVVVTDRKGDIEYANPSFTRTSGWTLEEARGRNPRLLRSGTHPPEHYQALWRTILGGATWQGELCNRRKDGALYWESASISPVRDKSGEITHFVAVKEDITERRRLAGAASEGAIGPLERLRRDLVAAGEALAAPTDVADAAAESRRELRLTAETLLHLLDAALAAPVNRAG